MNIADHNMGPAEIASNVRLMRKRRKLLRGFLLLSCITALRVTASLTEHGLRFPWLAFVLVIAEYAVGYALLGVNPMTGAIFLAAAGALFSLGTGLLSVIFGFAVLADP